MPPPVARIPGGLRTTWLVALACACASFAAPALAGAATLAFDAGTQTLIYTGGAGPNIVFADHPAGDPAHVRVVDVGGEGLTAAGAPACVPDDIAFHLVCPTPARLVVNLGDGDDAFSDESTGGGEPLAVTPVEVDGGAGVDELNGGEGADVLRGGAGGDTIGGGGGGDVVVGGDGEDTLAGDAGNDDLAGDLGNDRLSGGPGADAVRGGEGDDDLDYRPEYTLDGSDVLEGGPGQDRFGYFGRTASVQVVIDGLANDGEQGENDNVGLDVELVDGGDLADVLIGSAGANGLAGRGGDDRISGLAGGDVIYGDSGNDTLDGGEGDDLLDGGCHDDLITGGPGADSLNSDGTCEDPLLRGLNDVLQARDGTRDTLVLCTISGTPGDTAVVDPDDPALPAGNPGGCRTIDAAAAPPAGPPPPAPTAADGDGDGVADSSDACPLEPGASADRGCPRGVTRVGTARANTLVGTARADRLFGRGGRDRLRGLAGDDLLDGGAGADRLDEGAGDGTLRGGPGDDLLLGGPGNDRLVGGPGRDVLRGAGGRDRLSGGPGRDRLDAGAGNDAVDSRDGIAETVVCGAGRDSVRADRSDRLVGCEVARRG